MAFYSACAALVLSLAGTAVAECQSFGIDYEDGGSYFQNSNVNSTFTAYQQFNGCSNDTSHNVIVDPNGDQSECSQTPMLPSNTSQLVTCSNWTNANMYSGAWSILVISNNNNDSAIAFQRDFHLDVGQPNATVTTNPTSVNTIYATSTSYISVTSYVTATSNVVTTSGSGSASATGSGSASASGSGSASGSASGSGSASASGSGSTVTQFSSTTTTTTVTGSCGSSTWHKSDGGANIYPSVLGPMDAVASSVISKAHAAATKAQGAHDEVNDRVSSSLAARAPAATPMLMSAKFKRELLAGREPSDEMKAVFVQERAALLEGIAKRHPDNYTTTYYTGSTISSTYTSYVSTAVYNYTVYSTTTQVGLVGRDAQTVTTVVPTTITKTVTEQPSSCSSSTSNTDSSDDSDNDD